MSPSRFRPGRTHSGFRTGPLGLGHAVLTTPRHDELVRFYRDVLGFRLTDYCAAPFKAGFFHLNARHHSLAVIEMPEVGVHHLMVEMNNMDDVGQAYDLALAKPDGSGPGVTAWANWRPVIPRLRENHRVIAPDMMGFGYTDAPDVRFDLDAWVGQLTGLLDLLGVQNCHVVGDSFGGSVALHLATQHPQLVDRLVLMGPVGVTFPITPGLEDVWGYEPS